MNFKFPLLVLMACIFMSCEKLLFDENPSGEPIQNFESFWKEFDLNYSYFGYKNIRWDSVYDAYRPFITDKTTDAELFEILWQMLLPLKDGHVNISAPFGFKYYNFGTGSAPTANCISDSDMMKYFDNLKHPNSALGYGKIKDHDIGYLKIMSFGNPKTDYQCIDQIISGFETTGGIIVDLRNNGGGSDINSKLIVSRFTDEKRLYKKYRYRNGPGHNDFTGWIDDYTEPAGHHYNQTVVVLTNRGCFSTTEDCVMGFKVLPDVKIIGDTTGGGLGNPALRELPNGWLYRFSNWQVVDAEMTNFEGTGIPPDSVVWITKQDSVNGTDRILEAAIQMIDEKNTATKN